MITGTGFQQEAPNPRLFVRLAVFLGASMYLVAPGLSSVGKALNRYIKTYSTQEIVLLDPGEEFRFKLKDGEVRNLRLISVVEQNDSVIGLARWANVRVEIDGELLDLICGPYVMPTEVKGLRIQADTTTAWVEMEKRVQFSLWDASEPIVNTDRFQFPIPNYLLFSHGLQAFNEVVHLGRGDGDPKGYRFHHNYGVDLAAHEGLQEAVSCVDGVVVAVRPDGQGRLSSVDLRDAGGLVWQFLHFDSILPEIRGGAQVKRGQKIGKIGRTGKSGNFSHLHVGTVLPQDPTGTASGNAVRIRQLNLFPWLVAAYQKQYPRDLYAIAGPHQTVAVGQRVVLDGSRSLAFRTRIVSHRWEFDEGETVEGVRAGKTFAKPGVYVATLWIRGENGVEDVDFCRIKVFSGSKVVDGSSGIHPEPRMPAIFITYFPTLGVGVDQPVQFRYWPQRDPVSVQIDGEAIINDDQAHMDRTLHFHRPGIHVVTLRTSVDGKPITQKAKVIVEGQRRVP